MDQSKPVTLPLEKTHPLTALMTKKQDSGTIKKIMVIGAAIFSALGFPALAGGLGALTITLISTFAAGTAAALIIAQNLLLAYLLVTVIPALVAFAIVMVTILIVSSVVKKREKKEEAKPYNLEKSEKDIESSYRILSDKTNTVENFIKGYNGKIKERIASEIKELKKTEAGKEETARMPENERKDAIKKIEDKKKDELLGDIKKFTSKQKEDLKLTYNSMRAEFALENFRKNKEMKKNNKEANGVSKENGKAYGVLSAEITKLTEELKLIPVKDEARTTAQELIDTKTAKLQKITKPDWDKPKVDGEIKTEIDARDRRINTIANKLGVMITDFKAENTKEAELTKIKIEVEKLRNKFKIGHATNEIKEVDIENAIAKEEEIKNLEKEIESDKLVKEDDLDKATHYKDNEGKTQDIKNKKVPANVTDKATYIIEKEGLRPELKILGEVKIKHENEEKPVKGLITVDALKGADEVKAYVKAKTEFDEKEKTLKEAKTELTNMTKKLPKGKLQELLTEYGKIETLGKKIAA